MHFFKLSPVIMHDIPLAQPSPYILYTRDTSTRYTTHNSRINNLLWRTSWNDMYNYKESHSSKHTNNTCNTLPVKCTKQKRCFSHHTLEQEYPQNISICCAICVMSVQLSAPLPFFLDCSLEALFKSLTLSTLQVHWEEKATSVSTWRVQSFFKPEGNTWCEPGACSSQHCVL